MTFLDTRKGASVPVMATDEVTFNTEEEAIAELRRQISELDDRWKRASAEIENSRKRLTRDFEKQRNLDREEVILSFLPIVDTLERAIKTDGREKNPWYEGMKAVQHQMADVLKKYDVTAFNPKGEYFDPRLHEAAAVVSCPAEEPQSDGIVADVLLTGYTIGEGKERRVLRPARVAVLKRSG